MAEPTTFPEFNRSLGEPEGWDAEAEGECDVLPVWTDGAVCISCWRLSQEEMMEILQTGRIWIRIYSGSTQPAIMVHTESPFITEPGEAPEEEQG